MQALWIGTGMECLLNVFLRGVLQDRLPGAAPVHQYHRNTRYFQGEEITDLVGPHRLQ